MYIHSSSSSTPCLLTVLVWCQQTHLLSIKLAQTADNHATRRHVDTQRQRIGCKDCTQVAPCEERFNQHLQSWQKPCMVKGQTTWQKFNESMDLLQVAVFLWQTFQPDAN